MKFRVSKKICLNIFLFVAIWLLSFSIRTFVFERELCQVAARSAVEQPPSGTFLPFSIESAMAFNYASHIASGDLNILGPDVHLVGLGKLSVNRQFNVGNEYFLGYGYRLKKMLFGTPTLTEKDKVYENDPYFSSWASFQLRLWAALSTALIFLSLRILGLPISLALVGAFLHAVSPAAIARYTGQDIVGGVFTLPFLLASFASALAFMRRMSFAKFAIFIFCAFVSIATWDMTQVIFSVLCVFEIIRIALGGGSGRARRKLWIAVFSVVLIASFAIPYHRTHLLIFSPLLLFLLPVVLISGRVFSIRSFAWSRLAKIASLSLGLFFLSSLVGHFSTYSENYSHFGELMKAKLKFGNVKPKNPALLNFDARVLWVPAMHSADMKILKSYFPAALYLAPFLLFILFVFRFCSDRFHAIIRFRSAWLYLPFTMFLFYFISFFFIVRYHVFLIIFLSVFLPQLVFIFMRRRGGVNFLTRFASFAVSALIVMAIFLEAFTTLRQLRYYDEYFFGEVSSLIKWCRREGVSNKIFLADFELSPMLLAYCDSGIVIQPKFELGATRRKFEDYIKIAYHGTERDLMKFCAINSVDYYVYDRALAGPMDIYSPRYFANAPILSVTSPVEMMNTAKSKKKLRYFYEIIPPEDCNKLSTRYTVFKVITDENSFDAKRWALDGRAFLKKGNFDMARRLAKSAVYADPNCYSARLLYVELFSMPADIRLRGF